MLLEVSCTVEHFMEFLDNAERQGVKPDFDMHGADENSSFSSIADTPEPEPEPYPEPESETYDEEDTDV